MSLHARSNPSGRLSVGSSGADSAHACRSTLAPALGRGARERARLGRGRRRGRPLLDDRRAATHRARDDRERTEERLSWVARSKTGAAGAGGEVIEVGHRRLLFGTLSSRRAERNSSRNRGHSAEELGLRVPPAPLRHAARVILAARRPDGWAARRAGPPGERRSAGERRPWNAAASPGARTTPRRAQPPGSASRARRDRPALSSAAPCRFVDVSPS